MKFIKWIIYFFTGISFLILLFIVLDTFMEGIKLFRSYPIHDFILGEKWYPLKNIVGILPFILSTLYTGLIAVLISLPISIFVAVALVFYVKSYHKFIMTIFRTMTGIPSVIYGLIGFVFIVRGFEKNLNMTSGETIIGGGILLAVMVIPYSLSAIFETITKLDKKYNKISKSMGVRKEYYICKLILPKSIYGIISGMILSFGRAIGETMAVIMLIGNSKIMPTLFSKGETLSGLIALEMGSAEIESFHYYALSSAGFLLIIILIFTGFLFEYFLKRSQVV